MNIIGRNNQDDIERTLDDVWRQFERVQSAANAMALAMVRTRAFDGDAPQVEDPRHRGEAQSAADGGGRHGSRTPEKSVFRFLNFFSRLFGFFSK